MEGVLVEEPVVVADKLSIVLKHQVSEKTQGILKGSLNSLKLAAKTALPFSKIESLTLETMVTLVQVTLVVISRCSISVHIDDRTCGRPPR